MDGNLPNAAWGLGEQPLGLLDALLDDIIVQRAASLPFKEASQIVGIQKYRTGQRLAREIVSKMGTDEFCTFCTADSSGREGSASGSRFAAS